MDIRTPHTQELFNNLQHAFDFFNTVLFEDTLPSVLITIQRKRGARGYFWKEVFAHKAEKETYISEIALNPQSFDRTDKDILSTLVHEMCHLYQAKYGNPGKGAYHNKGFYFIMKGVGLEAYSVIDPEKVTGNYVSHKIIPGEEFDLNCDAFLKDTSISFQWVSREGVRVEKGTRKTREPKVKFICANCEDVAAWGKEDLSIVCGECGNVMELAE